jgi:hypothetical protein
MIRTLLSALILLGTAGLFGARPAAAAQSKPILIHRVFPPKSAVKQAAIRMGATAKFEGIGFGVHQLTLEGAEKAIRNTTSWMLENWPANSVLWHASGVLELY